MSEPSTRRLPLTTVASALAILVTAAALLMDTNIVKLGPLNTRIEGTEIVQVAVSWLLVFVAFRSDRIQAARAKTIEDEAVREAELIRVVHVTMTSVRDIVGNCLTELQHLRMEAEGKVPEEALSIFDESIRRAMSRLSAIESLEAFAEKEMAIGLGLHIEDLPGKHRNGKA